MVLRHGSMQLSYSFTMVGFFFKVDLLSLQNRLNTLEPFSVSMDTEAEVKEIIQAWTKHCIAFIEAGGNGEVGKRISSANRRLIESKVGECCPTCNMEMAPTTKRGRQPKKGESPERTSITVEHVVSRTLGGNNKLENLVAMCHRCNMCRNATMTKFIPIYASMHGRALTDVERDKVGRFIEWSIRTIRSPSTKIDAECSELFSTLLSKTKHKHTSVVEQNETENNNPVHTGYSTPSEGNTEMKQLLEVLQEIRDTQKSILEQLVRSKKHRLSSWFKGMFSKKKKSTLPTNNGQKTLAEPKKKPKKISKKKISPPPVQIEHVFTITEEFEQTIRNVLDGKKPMMLAVLGNELKNYQEMNQWVDTGTEAFLMMHGFSKKSGLKKAIVSKMPDEVLIEGEPPRQTISLKVIQDPIVLAENQEPLLEMNLESFRTACIAVIEEPMSPATFALRLGAHVSTTYSREASAKEFAHQCGIAKSWSLLKSLRTHVSDCVVVDGVGTAATIAPVR